jgi:hypothetical protein
MRDGVKEWTVTDGSNNRERNPVNGLIVIIFFSLDRIFVKVEIVWFAVRGPMRLLLRVEFPSEQLRF